MLGIKNSIAIGIVINYNEQLIRIDIILTAITRSP